MNFIILDFPYINRKILNTLSFVICNYLSCIWLNRDNLDYIDKKLKAKIIRERCFLKCLLKENFRKVFCTRYCDVDISQMSY